VNDQFSDRVKGGGTCGEGGKAIPERMRSPTGRGLGKSVTQKKKRATIQQSKKQQKKKGGKGGRIAGKQIGGRIVEKRRYAVPEQLHVDTSQDLQRRKTALAKGWTLNDVSRRFFGKKGGDILGKKKLSMHGKKKRGR